MQSWSPSTFSRFSFCASFYTVLYTNFKVMLLKIFSAAGVVSRVVQFYYTKWNLPVRCFKRKLGSFEDSVSGSPLLFSNLITALRKHNQSHTGVCCISLFLYQSLITAVWHKSCYTICICFSLSSSSNKSSFVNLIFQFPKYVPKVPRMKRIRL